MGEILSLDENASAFRPAAASAGPGGGDGPSGRHRQRPFFDRRELSLIMNIYGLMVARGEWRDYAIAQGRERCRFDVFRKSSDVALFSVVKQPSLARRQGMYAVIGASGRILKRGHDLAQVLRVFDKARLKPVD